MKAQLPTVAVVGRQNVGKSTLVNRLLGRRVTIADDAPGITRDRIELEAVWNGRPFAIVDTAGYIRGPKGIEALAAEQAERAVQEADLVLLVVDVQAGVTEEDARLARALRKAPVPILVAANKTDSPDDLADVAAFHTLGLGEPFDVSALHGRNAGDLLDRIVELLPPSSEVDVELEAEPAFAIVGRPNVGKSRLFNRLVGDERSVVSEISGTTRDAVDSVVTWPGAGPVRFVDTAGLRRGGRVSGIEYYSYLRATQAIERADVVVLVLDATAGFTGDDKRIANRVMDAGRALLIVANKWDLVEDKNELFRSLGETLRPFARVGVVRTSAATGQGVHRLPAILLDLRERWSRRAPTSTVNEILQEAQGERPTSRSAGSLHYATQVSSGPPTFVIFGGARSPDPGYQRYLEHRLRSELDLDGVPIRLRFRQRTGRRVGRAQGR